MSGSFLALALACWSNAIIGLSLGVVAAHAIAAFFYGRYVQVI